MENGKQSLRFAYSTINWGETADIAAAATEIRETGWSAVELFAHSLDWLGTAENLTRNLGGLDVATLFAFVVVPSDGQQLVRLKNQVAYAAKMGATHFGLVGGNRLRYRPPSAAEYADLANLCEALADFGEAHGVTVAYHPHVACTIETEDEIDRLLSATKKLTLCLDASHIALVDEDPVAHLRKYRSRTGYIHLKDWARGKFVEMGQGSIGIDFAAILAELESVNFPHWVVIEQSRSDVSPRESARVNAEYLRALGYDPGHGAR